MSKLDTMVKIYNKKLNEEKLAKGSADEILSDIKNIFWKRRFIYQTSIIFADIDSSKTETNKNVVITKTLDFAYLSFLCEHHFSYLQ